ncbi:MAG: hypothetical protein HKO77_05485 [Gemmatimonadetes bacterium]|nr:hypothetical protein [Gemmatimonadota bacterium]
MPHLRRVAGAALVLAAYLPSHYLLDVERTGPAGSSVRAAAEAAWVLGLSGSLIVLTFAWLLARMVPYDADRFDPVERLASLAAGPGRLAFATALGAVAFVEAAIVSSVVHHRSPTSVDGMAQLFHAAALTGGRLTIPLDGSASAWIIQNGLATGGGWVSVYPPGHTVLLAAGLAVGAAWLVGPVLLGLATAAFTWAADALLGPRTGRLAGILLCLSPFWLLLGATPANHVAAACGLALVLAAGVRARQALDAVEELRWMVGTGAAMGLAVASRPWTGLLCSTAILTSLWWPSKGQIVGPAGVPDGRRTIGRRAAALCLGGAPFALLLFAWNSTLFGSPFRLGYTAAFGPAHGLGFHDDPWGNAYGVVEAVAFTGSDLLLLGVRLLEGPLPALALIGFALVVTPWKRASRVFGAWAGAGMLAGFLYWHHGVHFGPRMMYETIPAWVALFAAAAAALLRADGLSPSATTARFYRWAVLVTLLGGVAFAPTAFRAAAGAGNAGSVPPVGPEPALVFVHGSWSSRLAARLAGSGMRRDSIETALRRNDICSVDRYTRWRRDGRAGPPPSLDLTPRSGTPTQLEIRELSPGNRVRIDPAISPDAACRREAAADRFGSLELEFFAWRYPPLVGRPVVAARDQGPAGNLAVLDALGRRAHVLVDGEPPVLLEYAEGMELLWGGAAGAAGR